MKQEGAREAEDYCESIIAELIDCLQSHYGPIKELIKAQESASVAQAQSSLQNLEVRMEEHKSRETELDHLSHTNDDVHFLQVLWTGSRSLLSVCVVEQEDPSNRFTSIKARTPHLIGFVPGTHHLMRYFFIVAYDFVHKCLSTGYFGRLQWRK